MLNQILVPAWYSAPMAGAQSGVLPVTTHIPCLDPNHHHLPTVCHILSIFWIETVYCGMNINLFSGLPWYLNFYSTCFYCGHPNSLSLGIFPLWQAQRIGGKNYYSLVWHKWSEFVNVTHTNTYLLRNIKCSSSNTWMHVCTYINPFFNISYIIVYKASQWHMGYHILLVFHGRGHIKPGLFEGLLLENVSSSINLRKLVFL